MQIRQKKISKENIAGFVLSWKNIHTLLPVVTRGPEAGRGEQRAHRKKRKKNEEKKNCCAEGMHRVGVYMTRHCSCVLFVAYVYMCVCRDMFFVQGIQIHFTRSHVS